MIHWLALITTFTFALVQPTLSGKQFTCPRGQVLSKIKNLDGYLVGTCVPLRCENLDSASMVCDSTYRKYCTKSTDFVVGFERREGEVAGRYGKLIKKHMYFLKCCSHPLLAANIVGLAPQPLGPDQEEFHAANAAVVGIYATNVAVNQIEPSGDHYVVDTVTVRCRREDPTTPPPPPPHQSSNNANQGGGGGGGVNQQKAPAPAPAPAPVPAVVQQPAPQPAVSGLDKGASEKSGDKSGNSGGSNEEDKNCNGVSQEQLKKEKDRLLGEGLTVQSVSKDPKDPEALDTCSGARGYEGCINRCQQLFGVKYIQALCVANPKDCSMTECVCIAREETREFDIASPDQQIYPVDPATGAVAFCFSADSLVTTPLGTVRMADVDINDQVMVAISGGEKTFQPVISFLHRDVSVTAEFLQIHLANGEHVELTSKHLIPVAKQCRTSGMGENFEKFFHDNAVFAEKAAEGDCLITADQRAVEITNIERVTKLGIYSPITESGQITVNGIVASCYSHVENHMLQKSLFNLYHKLVHYTQKLFAHGTDVTHPLSDWWITFGNMVSK